MKINDIIDNKDVDQTKSPTYFTNLLPLSHVCWMGTVAWVGDVPQHLVNALGVVAEWSKVPWQLMV